MCAGTSQPLLFSPVEKFCYICMMNVIMKNLLYDLLIHIFQWELQKTMFEDVC